MKPAGAFAPRWACSVPSALAFYLGAALLVVYRAAAVAELGPRRDIELRNAQPSLDVVDAVLNSEAAREFGGDGNVYHGAAEWERKRLLALGRAGPHLGCAAYGDGGKALSELRSALGDASIHRVSNSRERGTCFIVRATASDAALISLDLAYYGLDAFGILPSALKLSPGLLDFSGDDGASYNYEGGLAATYGRSMHAENVGGLEVQLVSEALPSPQIASTAIAPDVIDDLVSASVELHSLNFWSDEKARSSKDGNPVDLSRARTWTRAASLVHQLIISGDEEGLTPARICSWDSLRVLHGNGHSLFVLGEAFWQMNLTNVRER